MSMSVKNGGLSRRGLLGGVAAGGVGLLSAGPAMAEPSSRLRRRRTFVDWVDVTDHGVDGDRSADDQPALVNILDSVDADTTLYFPRGSYRLGSDLEFPSSVAVILDRGAVLEPDADTTLTVHCEVDAGLYRIFGGGGATVGSFAGVQVVPHWFGAAADGEHDDAPAIRAAVDALHAGGGGTVFLPAGTYLLQDTVGDSAEVGNHPFIIPRSEVHVVGVGDRSVLKAADGMNSSLVPGFNVIYIPDSSEEYRVDNASFRNFKIDCNGANNLQKEVDSGPKAKNCAIGARWGSNIVVDSVTIVNNAGRQCFQFGNNQKPQTITNLRITNCYVDTFGFGVEGNIHQDDHSVIYAQADGCVISGNVIVQPSTDENHEPVDNGTGIELHSKNAVITGNVMRNLDKAMNLVATVTDLIGVVVSDNVVRHTNKAIHLWCFPGHTAKEILISDNVFEQTGLGPYDRYPYDFGFLDASVQVRNQMTDLSVTGNVFTYAVAAEPQRGSTCVVLGAVRNAVVRDNRISGFTGAGIQIQESWINEPAGLEGSSITIEGNEIVDCGRSPDSGKRIGVNLVTRENLDLLVVRDNLFRTTTTDAMDTGIKNSVVAGTSRIAGNTWTGVPTPYSWSEAVIGETLSVEHIGPGDPVADAVPASVGSTWANPAEGKYWFKGTGNGNDGWQLRE